MNSRDRWLLLAELLWAALVAGVLFWLFCLLMLYLQRG